MAQGSARASANTCSEHCQDCALAKARYVLVFVEQAEALHLPFHEPLRGGGKEEGPAFAGPLRMNFASCSQHSQTLRGTSGTSRLAGVLPRFVSATNSSPGADDRGMACLPSTLAPPAAEDPCKACRPATPKKIVPSPSGPT